jgi:hypothetical protein
MAPELSMAAAKILIATVLLSIIAALLTGRALPRLVSRHDRAGLLTLKHRCGDLRSISQMADAGFDHLDSCL